MKQNWGSLFFVCIWFLLGILLFVQYLKHGFITLKEGTVIYGNQAIMVFSTLLTIGIIGIIQWIRTRRIRK
jgi:hypothetical protein